MLAKKDAYVWKMGRNETTKEWWVMLWVDRRWGFCAPIKADKVYFFTGRVTKTGILIFNPRIADEPNYIQHDKLISWIVRDGKKAIVRKARHTQIIREDRN